MSLLFDHLCVSCDSAARHIKQTEEFIMECGKLTAKLRDAVPVCFIEDGKEVKRFKNIEIPDEIKKLPYQDFEFSVPVTGAIIRATRQVNVVCGDCDVPFEQA